MTRQTSLRKATIVAAAIMCSASSVAEAFLVPPLGTGVQHRKYKEGLSFIPTALQIRVPPKSHNQEVRRISLLEASSRTNGSQQQEAGANDDEKVSSALDLALEKANLKEITQILKTNPGLNLNRKQWNGIFEAIEERTALADETTSTMPAPTEFPLQSAAREEMTELYEVLKDQKHLTLFGAIEQPLAAGSTSIPPNLLEQILDMKMAALTPQPTNTLLLAGIGLAVVEGFASVAFDVSLNLLAMTTLLLAFIDRLFLNGAVLESILKILSPGTQKKIVQHEAGHFLAAYLLGCPVEGIVLSAWAALQDKRFGSRSVSAGTSFYDPQLSKQINGQAAVTRGSIDRYSIIVMAGIAAEADRNGRADGGAGDEMALVSFLSNLNGQKGRTTLWNSDSIRNQARWGALQAVLMMREYKPAYDALVDALERGGTLGDCIYSIEQAARQYNLKPLDKPVGFIVEDKVGGVSWTKEMLVVEVPKEEDTKPEPFNEEASLLELQKYRSEVEEKLRTIEEKLKEIGD